MKRKGAGIPIVGYAEKADKRTGIWKWEPLGDACRTLAAELPLNLQHIEVVIDLNSPLNS